MNTSDFIRVEKQRDRVVAEALLFLSNSELPGGELTGWGLKAAIWTGREEQLVHANLRWEEGRNRGSGNGTIPLAVLRDALVPASPPLVIVHWPSWGVVTPAELDRMLREKVAGDGTWFCCPNCGTLFTTGKFIPEHCPDMLDRKGKEDQPYFGFPLKTYKGVLDLYVLGARGEPKELVKPSGHPMFTDLPHRSQTSTKGR